MKEVFVGDFVTAFLATWCANNYDEICMRGQHDRFDRMPVEDAFHLAEKAWKQASDHAEGRSHDET